MKIGLDLGTSEFRSVFPEGGRLLVRRIPAEYVAISDSPANRLLLDQFRVNFLNSDSHLIVVGKSARQVADLTHSPLIPLLPEGVLPEQDPVSRQLCDVILQSVIPENAPAKAVVTCVFPQATSLRGLETRKFLKRLLHLKYATIQEAHPATSLLLADGGPVGFSGISIVLGANSTCWSIGHFGNELCAGRVSRGIRQVIASLSLERHRYVWDVQGNRLIDFSWGESLVRDDSLDLSSPRTGDEQLLRENVIHLLKTALSDIVAAMEALPPLAGRLRTIPILIGGAPARIKGLTQVLQELAAKKEFPCRIGKIVITSPDPFKIARGALISAELQSLPHAA